MIYIFFTIITYALIILNVYLRFKNREAKVSTCLLLEELCYIINIFAAECFILVEKQMSYFVLRMHKV